MDWKVKEVSDKGVENICPAGYGTSTADNTKCGTCSYSNYKNLKPMH